MKAVLATGIEELGSWAASYADLLGKVGGQEQLYYSLDVLRISAVSFQALGASMFFILVTEDAEVLAVLPLMLLEDGIFNLRRTIRFWGDLDIYAVNTYRKILAAGSSPEAVDTAVSFLTGPLSYRWDQIAFSWLPMEDDNIRRLVTRLPHAVSVPEPSPFYYFDTDVPLDRQLGRRCLKELRRRRRNLEAAHGPVRMVFKDRIDEEDLEVIARIHTDRQLFKQECRAFFNIPVEDGYVRRLIALWNRLGCVHYYALMLDGQTLAVRIMIFAGGISCGFLAAFDSRYEKYAPGRTLAYEAFKYEIVHFHPTRIDLVWGRNSMKTDYASDSRELFNIGAPNRRFRSRVVLLAIHLLYLMRRPAWWLKNYMTHRRQEAA